MRGVPARWHSLTKGQVEIGKSSQIPPSERVKRCSALASLCSGH